MLSSLLRRFLGGLVLPVLGLGLLLLALLVWTLELPVPFALGAAVPVALLYALVCRSARYLVRVSPGLGIVAAAGGVAGLCFLAMVALVVALSGQSLAVLGRQWPLVLGLGAATYLLSAAAFLVRAARTAALRARAKARDAARLAQSAELAALQARLRPHFLFNALQSIAALIGSDPVAGRRMCIELADFLRARLDSADTPLVALEEELRITRQYLGIERMRFADRLRIEEDIDPLALGHAVPPLLLQPLVENAIKHGIARLEEGGTVQLAARRNGDELVLTVSNPTEGRPASAARQGHGLALVRQRLEAQHGSAARMVVDASAGTFRVTLHLPARGLS